MENWETYTIEDCCHILDSKRIPLNKEQREKMQGDIPYCGANGIQGYINQYIFNDDLILIAEDGGNFEQFATRPIAYRISGKSWVNNHAHVLKAKNGFNQDMIFYSLVNKNILTFILGGTRSKLNQSELKKIIIKVPKLEREQTQIATILSKTDQAIEQTEKLIAKYQRIKTGLMQDILTKGIDENGNIRSEETHEFKDSAVGRIPTDWHVYTLNDLLQEKKYGISVPLDYYEEGIPVLRMGNLKDGEVDYSDLKFSNSKEANAVLLNPLDVLFNRTNSIDYVGRTGIFRGHKTEVSFASYLVKLVPDKSKLHPEFLNLWLNFPKTEMSVKRLATIGVQQVNVNPTNLGTLLISLPKEIEEQERIMKIIMTQNKRLGIEQGHLSKLQKIKTGLMQDLLTGKVRVTVCESDH